MAIWLVDKMCCISKLQIDRDMDTENLNWRIIAFPLHESVIMTLHTQTPHELRMWPVDFGVKGQGHYAWVTENGNWHIIAFPLHLQS